MQRVESLFEHLAQLPKTGFILSHSASAPRLATLPRVAALSAFLTTASDIPKFFLQN
jgi:hypothetical protein